MNALSKQLARAYQQEEKLYVLVRDLVAEQKHLMETSPDPRAIVGLCSDVEHLMGEIAIIEAAIEPAKRRWAERKETAGGELDGVLASVQAIIEETARTQQEVQKMLLSYMERHKGTAHAARAQVSASKAQALYSSS